MQILIKQNVDKGVNYWDKLLFLALFVLFLTPFQAFASDTFQNIPDTNVPYGTLPTIGDFPTATEAEADSGDAPYWDIAPFVNASSSFDLSIVNMGSTSTTQIVDGQYLNLWYRGVGSYVPYCPAYVTDGGGNIKGTLQSYPGSGGAANYTWYSKNILGNNVLYTLCQYVMDSSYTTFIGGPHFTASSTGNGYLHIDFGTFYGGGRIYAVYGTASSTEHEYGSIPGCSTSGIGDCTTEFQSFLASKSNSSDTTRIISFTPEEGELIASGTPVGFSLNAYIASQDFGSFTNIRISLHNIDQNVLFSSFSDNDIVLYQALATSSGYFSFATSTLLDSGNYRIEASLMKTYLYGVVQNPFSGSSNTQSHQFIVGSSTFLGSISQKSFAESQALYKSFTATSTEALAGTCNILSGFDTLKCLAFLFIPSSDQLNSSLVSLRQGVLTHIPWGYTTRLFEIVNGSSTSALPAYSVEIPYNANADTINFSLDMNQAFASATEVLEDTRDPIHGNNLRDLMETIIKSLVAFAVLYEIISDITGMYKNNHNRKHST